MFAALPAEFSDSVVAGSLRYQDGASIVVAITERRTYDEARSWTMHVNGRGLCTRGGCQLSRFANPQKALEAATEAAQ
jgi:hypothetical protein